MTLFPKGEIPFKQFAIDDLWIHFINDAGSENGSIGVANFQRNAVWKEHRVEALWDSILTGLPIGSILLARNSDFPDVGARAIQPAYSSQRPTTLEETQKLEYLVIDGQQRMNAIWIGCNSVDTEPDARLWIDLAGPQNPAKTKFDFHLCTLVNPWGRGVSDAQKREALQTIGHSEFDESPVFLKDTYPINAKVPCPFYDLVHFVRTQAGENGYSLQKYLVEQNSTNIHKAVITKLAGNPSIDLSCLIEAIQWTFIRKKYFVSVTLYEDGGRPLDKNLLGRLFDRVNTGGETPDYAELFFSALKLRWPPANDLVGAIFNDPLLRNIAKPTNIVLTTVRMSQPGKTELKLDEFDAFYSNPDNERNIQELLSRTATGESKLHQYLKLAYTTLRYNGSPSDKGLPPMLINRLRVRVWQTIVMWLDQRKENIDSGIDETSRAEMIRYVLMDTFDYFLEAEKKDIHRLAESTGFWNEFLPPKADAVNFRDSLSFPGKTILQILGRYALRNGWKVHLLSPKEYRDKIQPVERETSIDIPWYTLQNENSLLMFAQRDLLKRNYMLDLDHIIPRSWTTFYGPKGNWTYWSEEYCGDWNRGRFVDRVGNFRYWPKKLNRALGNKDLKQKYLIDDPTTPIDQDHGEFCFKTAKEVRQNSFFPEAGPEYDLWERASTYTGYHRQYWKDRERLRAYIYAAFERRARMYAYLYETTCFNEWAFINDITV